MGRKKKIENEEIKSDVVFKKIEEMKEILEQEQSEKEQENLKEFDKNKYFNIFNHLFLKTKYNEIPFYPNEVAGLLFIGDPHYWSKRPGRRLDDYSQTILNKLTESIDYANKNNLLIIILGDLFEEWKEETEAITKLIRVLKKAKYKIISAVGNHDINEHKLTDKNPLKMLEEAGIIDLMEDNGFYYQIKINNNNKTKTILLGATPYGMPIPNNVLPLLLEDESEKKIYKPLTESQIRDIEEQEKGNKTTGNLPIYLKQNKTAEKTKEKFIHFKNENNIADIIWITHHDLAMSGAYPNSIALKEIIGVDKVINGHIHGLKKPVKIDNTVYYNTGNIARTKIDLISEKPAVWKYDFSEQQIPSINGLLVKQLIPYYLTISEGKDVFRLTGKHSGKNNLTEEDILEIKNGLDLSEDEEKIFASLLYQQQETTQKTDDGALIEQSLLEFIKEREVNEEIGEILLRLFEKSTLN